MSATNQSRRDFIRLSTAAAAGLATPWALQLDGISAAAADGDPDDYRALVCVFLYGGNDHYNSFVPFDEGYGEYARLRKGFAVPRGTLLEVDPNGFSGAGTLAFAPQLSRLHNLYTTNKVAMVANVGSMIAPLVKPSWDSNPSLVPPSLGSHNDQQSFWMSGLPEGANTGWGGRIGDALNNRNGDATTYMCTSVTGNAVLLTGNTTQQFQVSTEGPTALDSSVFKHATSMNDALDTLLRRQSPGLFPSTYSAVSRRALESSDRLTDALTAVEGAYDFNEQFQLPEAGSELPRNPLSEQLRMVAKMIVAGREQLGMKRQVFFVGMGGFDTHNDLADVHPALLGVVDDAMASFYETTVGLGVENSVTTFTGSDFGRTLSLNDNGSDHGWGSTHMVMGGAVNGNRTYGQVPTVALDGPDSIGRGRQLPTTSVDQYGATLAHWMGAGANLDAIFPNIGNGNFTVSDLGFMKAN